MARQIIATLENFVTVGTRVPGRFTGMLTQMEPVIRHTLKFLIATGASVRFLRIEKNNKGSFSARMSAGIHFHVQMNRFNLNVPNGGILKFNVENLNPGWVFDVKTGTFTVPRNGGVYHLVFKGTTKTDPKNGISLKVLIALHRNDDVIGTTPASAELNVIVATWKLTKGDRIYF